MKCGDRCTYCHVIAPVIKGEKYRIRCDWFNKPLHAVAHETREDCPHGRENVSIYELDIRKE